MQIKVRSKSGTHHPGPFVRVYLLPGQCTCQDKYVYKRSETRNKGARHERRRHLLFFREVAEIRLVVCLSLFRPAFIVLSNEYDCMEFEYNWLDTTSSGPLSSARVLNNRRFCATDRDAPTDSKNSADPGELQ